MLQKVGKGVFRETKSPPSCGERRAGEADWIGLWCGWGGWFGVVGSEVADDAGGDPVVGEGDAFRGGAEAEGEAIHGFEDHGELAEGGARIFVEKTVWISIRDSDWDMAEFADIEGMDATPSALGNASIPFPG